MKKSKNIFIKFFIITFFFIGCASRYDAEKMYWHINKKYSNIMVNLSKVSEKEFNKMITDYKKVIESFPSWEQSSYIQFTIGQMYVARNDFKNAKEELAKVYINYPDEKEIGAKAMFYIGLLYEREENFKDAVKQIKQTIEKYKKTSTGLQIPVYLIKYYVDKNMKEESEKAYEDAIHNYMNLIEENPNDKVVPILQDMIINASSQMLKWDNAVNLLTIIYEKYPKSEFAPLAIYKKAIIYRDMLRMPQESMLLFTKIIHEYPKSKLGSSSQFELGNISILSGNYEKARKDFNKILEQYKKETSLCAAAQLSIAATYEKANKWENALLEYKKTENFYPDTIEALQVPILIARHYEQLGQKNEMNNAIKEGIKKYNDIINSKTKKNLVIASYESLSILFTMQQKWNEALSSLITLREKYSEDIDTAPALFRIGLIYHEGLNDIPKAIETYNKFLAKYPEHSFSQHVHDLLNKIQNIEKNK